jgi:branched-subunit amino acid aminotransferase/4-amino-4-deoxychorismate lyase
MQASRLAAARGADEAVYVRPDGIVLEAPTSSIFWVDAGGELRTPALTVGILDSITRDAVIAGLPVAEGSFDRADLLAAGEAFLASTNREIPPISIVAGEPLPTVGGAAAGAAAEVLAAAVDAERATARA